MGKRGPKKGTKYKKESELKPKAKTVELKKPEPLPIFDEEIEGGSLFVADEPAQEQAQPEIDKTLEHENTAVQMTVGLFNTLGFIPQFRKLKNIKESDIYCKEALGRQYGKHLAKLNSDEADYVMIAVCFGGIIASSYEGKVNESSKSEKQHQSDTRSQGSWKDYPIESSIREV